MRAPERLVEVWAAGSDGRGNCGSGWVVGQRGVISCRHVVDSYLACAADIAQADSAQPASGDAGQGTLQIRQVGKSTPDDWVDCNIAWRHPARDLVLLRINPRPGQSWDFPSERQTRLTRTGQRPSDCYAIGFPDAQARTSGLRDSEQVSGRLLWAGTARDPDGLVPFDTGDSVADDAALWKGFSGSAVFDEHNRLAGLVVRAHPKRQLRRLLIVPIEDAATDPDFAVAAATVGLDPTVEDYRAPLWRECVEPRALTTTGVPSMVADVRDLRAFGVRATSAPAEGRGLPADYVSRDKDSVLRTALLDSRSGGRRVVLLLGDSAAGKSRSAAEAVRRDQVLRHWRLVVPLSDGGLQQLARADVGWQDTVLWLDDLDKYLAHGMDLGIVRQVLGSDPAVVVVATMRRSQLQARQSRLADPAWGFLNDKSEVAQVDLEAALSDDELQAASASISDPALLNALHDGVGLGEWLVAGPELMNRLSIGSGLERALADAVVAWYRTGLALPLTEQDARLLWAQSLPPTQRQRLLSRDPGQQGELFEAAAAWACEPVVGRDLYEQALVTRLAAGYVANDYVVDQTVLNPRHPKVADSVWERALQVATSSAEPYQKLRRLWSVGNAAWGEQAFAFALTAIQTLVTENTDARLIAAVLLSKGSILKELGRPEEAVNAFSEAVKRFSAQPGPEMREGTATALVSMGETLSLLGRQEEAVCAFGEVVDRFGKTPEPELREPVVRALVRKGTTLGLLGRHEEAVSAFGEVVDRFGNTPEPELRELLATAQLDKGVAFGELGRTADEIDAYDEVVTRFAAAPEPGVRELVATALLDKGAALGPIGQVEEAISAFDDVVARFGNAPEPAMRNLVANALINKGFAFDQLRRPDAAVAAHGEVVTRFGEATEVREQVSKALLNKGFILGRMDRLEAAAEAFDEVVTRSGDAPETALRWQAAQALLSKGVALGRLGRPQDAAEAFDEVVTRLAGAAEPALASMVTLALNMKADIERGQAFLFPGEGA
jgi:tetratricopeptide (TPR) repeat protein